MCCQSEFRYVLIKMQEKNPGAAKYFYLWDHREEYSAVTFLAEYPRYGDALNSAAECFNSILVKAGGGQPSMHDMAWLSL